MNNLQVASRRTQCRSDVREKLLLRLPRRIAYRRRERRRRHASTRVRSNRVVRVAYFDRNLCRGHPVILSENLRQHSLDPRPKILHRRSHFHRPVAMDPHFGRRVHRDKAVPDRLCHAYAALDRPGARARNRVARLPQSALANYLPFHAPHTVFVDAISQFQWLDL